MSATTTIAKEGAPAGASPRYHVYFPFIGRNIGGSHISAFTLADALVKDFGIPCSVIARRDTPIVAEAAAMKFGVVSHVDEPATAGNGRHGPLYDLRRLPARLKLLRGLPKGILHFNDIGGLQSWLLPAKILGWPTVYHHRAMNRKNVINRAIIGSADHAIPISIDTTKGIDYVPASRRTTIVDPYAIDADVDRDRARQELVADLDIPADALIVAFIGNLWKRKRPEFFLEVAAVMAAREPRAVFVIFGGKGDFTIEDMKAQASRLGIADRVRTPGFRTPIEDNVAAMDLLLVPSLREPFTRAPIESILLGKPFVGSDDAGTTEIVARWQGGRLAPKDASPADFAEIALAVLADPGAVILPSQRRQEIASELSPREHAKRVMEIYDRLRPRL